LSAEAGVAGVDFEYGAYNVTFAPGQQFAQIIVPLPQAARTNAHIIELVVSRVRNVVPSSYMTAGLPICLGYAPDAASAEVAGPSPAIIGGAIGGILLAVGIIGVIIVLVRRRSSNKAMSERSSRKLASVTPVDDFTMSNPAHGVVATRKSGVALQATGGSSRVAFTSTFISPRHTDRDEVTVDEVPTLATKPRSSMAGISSMKNADDHLNPRPPQSPSPVQFNPLARSSRSSVASVAPALPHANV
jgi:hypothetical protein